MKVSPVSARPGRDVAVITPWYPSGDLPFRGAFVQAMVEATAPGCDRMTVYHTDGWWVGLPRRHQEQVRRANLALLGRARRTSETVAGARLVRVPTPAPVGATFAAISERYSDALTAALGGQKLDAAVVHAHVGVQGGWPAIRNARPDARVFVTEHATFLDNILAEPTARQMYDRVLHRCTRFFAVGHVMRDLLAATFPHHADRIDVVPNPIDFGQPRPEPVRALRRWLFVGGLNERKGVEWLLEAFAKCQAEQPELTLTLVGDGVLGDRLRTRAGELGVAGAVTFTGAVPPDAALRLMREHDVLVHPSRMETFGMTIVEAVAAGMPVIVTRCGGPEETLAGIEEAAGELIEVRDSAEPIVAGFRRLRARFPHGTDLGLAQRTLADRYGYPAALRAHHRAWFDDPVDGVGAGAVAQSTDQS